MKFGISLFPTVGPSDRDPAQYFADSLRLAELADEWGFDHVKTVEHHFYTYGGYSPDPVTFLAAAAGRTRRVRLVTGAVIPAFSHPIKLAGSLAMLDNISRGRLDVGFGRAFLPGEFEAFGVAMDESRLRFAEGVEACRRLWAQEDVVWAGRFHRFGPVTLLPRPYQRPHPPILVASAVTLDSCEAAGRLGYGLMVVPAINKREKLQEMLATYRAAHAESGADPAAATVHMSYNCYLAEDAAEARRLGGQYSARTTSTLLEAVAAWAHTRSEDYRGYEQIVERVRRSDFDSQVRDAKTLVGSPAEVLAMLQAISEWYGDVTVSLQVISGNPPFSESQRTMRLFAEHILPRFAGQANPTPADAGRGNHPSLVV